MDEFTLPPPFDQVSAEEFDRERSHVVERLRKSSRPAKLRLAEGAEIVVQSTKGYQALLAKLDRAEESVGIYRGLESARRGGGVPLDEAFQQIHESAAERLRSSGEHRPEKPTFPIAFDEVSSEEFNRDRNRHVERLRETGRPARLAVEAGSEVVVQSADAYRELLAKLDYTEALVGIYRGHDQVLRGETIPLEESFRGIRERAERRRRTA